MSKNIKRIVIISVIFLVLVLVVRDLVQYSNKLLITPISEEGFMKYSYCVEDSECVLARNLSCASCGCPKYINKNLKDEYTKKAEETCENYNGPVCGVTGCPQTKPKCLEGSCVGVARNYDFRNTLYSILIIVFLIAIPLSIVLIPIFVYRRLRRKKS